MITNVKDYFKYLWGDVRRLVMLAVIVILFNEVDKFFNFTTQYAYITALLTSTSIVLVVAAVSHIVRRILFPTIYMGEFAKKAMEDPIGAALIYLGICIVTAVFVVVNIQLLN